MAEEGDESASTPSSTNLGVKRASEQDEPAPKRTKPLYTETLRVLVGPDEVQSTIHKSTACVASEFFRLCCSSERWVEGRDKTVRLPECDPEAFNVFAHWAYAEKLDMSLMTEVCAPRYPPSYRNLSTAWTIGNFLQARRFRNAVIDKILQKVDATRCTINYDTLAHIWAHTPQGATIQQLAMDVELAGLTRIDVDKDLVGWPSEIVLEAARHYLSGRSRDERVQPTFATRCKYHEHEEGEEECT